ncbi:hypothetical protein GCM10009557_49970 [Virgisporangium ochraceum]|uniref:Uncharacterized protein n=1 Tax=Virgisporangium ochraceum TaxID=65505 RepID=A0A8J4ECY7_9ACTN|nr:hypothetical protein [Virgisporangium ochraceum]GIJ70018.1 hypothetical protein Voc01_049350 [Virgisporangium ochraceum]
MAQSEQRPIALFFYLSCAFGFAGALMLILTPLLPLAYIDLLGESIETDLGGSGWGVALLGLVAGACPAMAIVQRNPVWATGMLLPAIVAIGWSGWYTFSRIPELARLADSASLGWGGVLFVFSGPVLMIGGMGALIATYGRLREQAEAAERDLA